MHNIVYGFKFHSKSRLHDKLQISNRSIIRFILEIAEICFLFLRERGGGKDCLRSPHSARDQLEKVTKSCEGRRVLTNVCQGVLYSPAGGKIRKGTPSGWLVIFKIDELFKAPKLPEKCYNYVAIICTSKSLLNVYDITKQL